MKTDDVGVALANDHFIGLNNVGLGPIKPVQRFRLRIDGCLGRVFVFRWVCASRQNSATKCNGLTTVGKNWEQHTSAKRVLWFTPLVDEGQSDFCKQVD